MKQFVIAFVVALLGFVNIAHAENGKEYGWKPVVDTAGKITGMSNVGEQGGVLTLTCDVATKNLKMSYRFGGNDYDFYLFRKFGAVEMDKPNQEGIFYVGPGSLHKVKFTMWCLIQTKRSLWHVFLSVAKRSGIMQRLLSLQFHRS